MDINNYCYDGRKKFDIEEFDCDSIGEFNNREEAVDEFVQNLLVINKEQQKLYSERKEGVIFIFQAMDAAGKDGVIRTVFSTLSPHGVKEFCFKVPSSEEKSHDFLWRFWSALPPRGSISIFNRSYYEDVLIGRVHELYKYDIVPDRVKNSNVIKERYRQITNFERYLYETGTRIVKIFLNVSKDEQARRFISRIDTPRKNWKVSPGDLKEREYWDKYMEAFEKMINQTSTGISPWYVVPADHKWYARLLVSRIVRKTLEDMKPKFPTIEKADIDSLKEARAKLAKSLGEKAEKPIEPTPKEFYMSDLIPADIVKQDMKHKQKRATEKIKDNGFRAVRELLAESYMIHSLNDIVDAIAREDEESENNPDVREELDINPEQVKQYIENLNIDEEEK